MFSYVRWQISRGSTLVTCWPQPMVMLPSKMCGSYRKLLSDRLSTTTLALLLMLVITRQFYKCLYLVWLVHKHLCTHTHTHPAAGLPTCGCFPHLHKSHKAARKMLLSIEFTVGWVERHAHPHLFANQKPGVHLHTYTVYLVYKTESKQFEFTFQCRNITIK